MAAFAGNAAAEFFRQPDGIALAYAGKPRHKGQFIVSVISGWEGNRRGHGGELAFPAGRCARRLVLNAFARLTGRWIVSYIANIALLSLARFEIRLARAALNGNIK